uniref:Dynein axonemal assembly factor 6 n=1 Tax=Callorhinchus milii TaxID=7868 RepID=V9LAE0_CALMI|eukprot:gi/632987915/ref/XP_007882823.1/ PREDICTED: protein PIH1D3 [Callorhinchus milii]
MDSLLTLPQIQALTSLLAAPEENEEELEQKPLSGAGAQGPGHIGPQNKSQTTEPADRKPTNKDIWAEEEVLEGAEFDDIWDKRQQPEYEILFKQRVGTEDVFLGVSRKDGSTACCEDMVIRINLPDTKLSDVTLDVNDRFLTLRSPHYKLGLHLPHAVDSKNGKAQLISSTSLLEVTLTMKRELDFVNFA